MNLNIKRWHWLCMALAGLFYLVFIWKNSFVVGGERYFSLFDDAMIGMRFAKNLADGFGLRWNPGEAPVEGYTDFLWVLFMAAIHLLPIAMSKTSLVVMLSGVVILLANLLVVKKITEAVAGGNLYAPLVCVILTAFYYPLIYWTLRGMEVGLLCLLVNGAILCAFRLHDQYSLRHVLGLTLLLSIAELTRPDMVVPAIVLGGFMLYVVWKSGFKLTYLIFPLALAAVMGGLTLFRIKYYGDPLPNTYYLKVTGVTLWERASRGIRVLLELFAYHLWPVLLLLAAGLTQSFRKRPNPKVLLLLAMFFGTAAYSVYVGGDAWEWMNFSNRYICIAVPALFVVLSLIVCDPEQFAPRSVIPVLPALGAGLFVQSIYYLEVKPDKLAAAGLIAVGLLVLAVGAGVVRLNRRHQINPLVLTATVTLLLCLTLNFFGIAGWLFGKNNGALIVEDAIASRDGLLLNQATTPNAKIAYVWAGAMPYFAGRSAIELLGKNDKVVAKGKPVASFYPGHNKWNYAHSIGELKPDLVADMWKPTESDKQNMLDWGYVTYDGGFGGKLYLRKDSTNVNIALLSQPTP